MSRKISKVVLCSCFAFAVFFSAAAEESGASSSIWSLPVKLKDKNIDGLVNITDMRVNENLVHYMDDKQLGGLTMSLEYDVITPAQCYLVSRSGSMYWHNINLANLNRSSVYSGEKIDLREPGKHKTTVSFGKIDSRYMESIAKGPNCVRGHHSFGIMDSSDSPVGATDNTDSLTSPEKAAFGSQGNDIIGFYRNTLYTLANLENYKLEIADFSSDWKSAGFFAFRIYVVDADGKRYEVNRADVELAAVFKSGRGALKAEQAFDRYNIPQGYFTGKFGIEVPEKIEIKVRTVAASPRGREERSVEKTFSRGEDSRMIIPGELEKTAKEPGKEGRMIFMCPYKDLSQEESEGINQIRNIVRKAKECNFNVICPMAMGNRCHLICNIDNKYYQRLFPKWDPFLEFRKATKAAGLKLHAFICVLPEGAEKLKGILVEHPEWAATDQNGNKKGWLDPVIPEVKEYRINDIVEIVRKYDLDGFCLDYCRLSGGPSDRGAEIYMAETGIDPRKLTVGSREYIDWYIWTGNHLTDLVRRIHEGIKKAKPDCMLTAYVQGVKYDGEDNKYKEYHQNFTEWLRKGYLDVICPTGYIYDMLRFKSWAARQIKACKEANPNIPVLITIGVKSSHGALQTPQELVDQIDTLRKLNGDGAAFFTWTSLEKWVDTVKSEAYTQETELPVKAGK